MKEPILYKIVRPIITILVKIVFHPKYIGLENIPASGPVVLGGNHTNNLDCALIISSTKRVVHFLAKDSLLKGIKGIIFKNIGIIPVNRSIHDKKALNNAIIELENKKLIGIFPEGTINRTKDITMPFKIGCVKMTYESDAHIVPFVITGKYKLFNNNLTIEFLPAYKIKHNKANDKDLSRENEYLRNLISQKLEEKRKQK